MLAGAAEPGGHLQQYGSWASKYALHSALCASTWSGVASFGGCSAGQPGNGLPGNAATHSLQQGCVALHHGTGVCTNWIKERQTTHPASYRRIIDQTHVAPAIVLVCVRG